MGGFDIFKAEAGDWATSLEVSGTEGAKGEYLEKFFADERTKAFIVTVSCTSIDQSLTGFSVRLNSPDGWQPQDDEDSEARFVQFKAGQPSVIVIANPAQGRWELLISSDGQHPFEVNAAMFNTAPAPLVASSKPNAPSGQPSGRCRICKVTSKALSFAIVAVAGHAAVPHALLAAIAAYLGKGLGAAVAFVGSVVGDTVSMVAEKLCKSVRLCP